jgi:hypothetical protein
VALPKALVRDQVPAIRRRVRFELLLVNPQQLVVRAGECPEGRRTPALGVLVAWLRREHMVVGVDLSSQFHDLAFAQGHHAPQLPQVCGSAQRCGIPSEHRAPASVEVADFSVRNCQ